MTTSTARLQTAETELASCYLTARPLTAAQQGQPEWSGQLLPLVSADRQDDLAARIRLGRAALAEVTAADLDAEDRLTLDMLTDLTGHELTALSAHAARYTVTPLPEAGLTSALLLFLPEASLGSAGQLETFARACAAIPAALEESLAELATGRAAGQHPVAHLTRRALEQLDQYLATEPGLDSYVTAARAARLPAADQATAERLTADVSAIVTGAIRPAFERYRAALATEVLPAARGTDRPGVCWLPDGPHIYRAAVRAHTTLEVEPAGVHEAGRALVAAIKRRAEAIGAALGWDTGFGAIRDRMRADRSLYFTSAEQLLAAADAAMRRALTAVPEWIGDLPAATCEVRDMNPLETRNGVLGHYQAAPLDRHRPARYWLNTADPASRPVYEAETLAHHESVPGHHIEIAASQEAAIASPFRRLAEVTTYREGWALYAEQLADRMGLYSGPLDRLGMLSFQLWRAGRLVVDTGLHELGWSRDQAVSFLWENSILTRGNIENEIDRYIACPGQALGHMTGQLAFEQLRSALVTDETSAAQHRAFHSQLLAHGPLTIGCLSRSLGVSLAVLS